MFNFSVYKFELNKNDNLIILLLLSFIGICNNHYVHYTFVYHLQNLAIHHFSNIEFKSFRFSTINIFPLCFCKLYENESIKNN